MATELTVFDKEVFGFLADHLWAIGIPIRVVGKNIDRVIRNPKPSPNFIGAKISSGQERFKVRLYVS